MKRDKFWFAGDIVATATVLATAVLVRDLS
jgi:hypothetical protein